MDFRDVVFFSSAIQEDRAEKTKADLIAASFTAWQIRASQGDKTQWPKYIKQLGLSDREEKLTDKEKKAIAHKAKCTASRIIEMDKKRKK